AQLKQVRAAEDPAQLEQLLSTLEQQKGAVPAEMRPALDLMEAAARERLETLRAAAEEGTK
ncbi:MAG: hypothetical protein H6Q03_2263, partial [Acidobacteria bacterium]|nr:hypothetical protein [Acidobacteriota bacterium]